MENGLNKEKQKNMNTMIFKIIWWIILQIPYIKRIKFRYEIYKIAHDAQSLFFSQTSYSYSIPTYLSACHASDEGIIISDWWHHSYYKSPFLFRFYFFEPEEILCITNRARDVIKRAKEGLKNPEYKEIYTEMAQKFNSFCEDLEKISKKFPDLCKGLSYIEKLPN